MPIDKEYVCFKCGERKLDSEYQYYSQLRFRMMCDSCRKTYFHAPTTEMNKKFNGLIRWKPPIMDRGEK